MTTLPDSSALVCQIGAVFAEEFLYWDNLAGTIAHDFTGWTLQCVIEHQNGSQTTVPVSVTSNSVLISLKADVTSTFRAETARYLLSMVNNSDPTDVYYLGAGNLEIVGVV